MMNVHVVVGATVRLPRPEISKAMGRATVATIQADDATACVLWEPLAPQPLHLLGLSPRNNNDNKNDQNSTTTTITTKINNKRRLKRDFLIVPLFEKIDRNVLTTTTTTTDEEAETTVALSELSPLLDFETQVMMMANNNNIDSDESIISQDIAVWKDRGDQLLRLGDTAAGCCYYEMALQLSSILQVGSAVIVRQGGHAKVADVDCLDDDDDNCIEVSMVESGEEKVIKESDILLCILHNDSDDHLQERILLNLARCLLQLAELAKHQEIAISERRPRYLRSSVLAATLVLTIAEHHRKEEDTDSSSNNNLMTTNLEQTALLLRSQAQSGLGKFQNALADNKRLLTAAPEHKEGLKQLQSLQGQLQRQKLVDKKLVKSMCQWVQTATNNKNDNDPVSPNPTHTTTTTSRDNTLLQYKIAHATSVSNKKATITDGNPVLPVSPPSGKSSIMMDDRLYRITVYLIFPLLVAFFIQQLLG